MINPQHKTRTTKSFIQAVKWSTQARRKAYPGKEREAARRSIMDACRWADALVKRWDAAGQPGLMTIQSASQLEFELFSGTLARCFAW